MKIDFKKIYLTIPFIIVCIISILLFCQACLLNTGEVELEDKIRELENENAVLNETIQEQESIIERLEEEKKGYEMWAEHEINLYKDELFACIDIRDRHEEFISKEQKLLQDTWQEIDNAYNTISDPEDLVKKLDVLFATYTREREKLRDSIYLSQTECDTDNNARIRIINKFSNNWLEFQRNISQRPILGSTGQPWGAPNDYQFIGNNRMFIAFDDGHIALASVIQYNCDKGSTRWFTLLDTFANDYPFSETRWSDLFNQYGDTNRLIHSYTRSIFKGGQLIQYDNWTEVPENVFIWHPKGY